MAIQFLQDVAIHGGIQFLDAKESFPENPSIGTMVLKGTAIYAYIAIGGMETWYPFANRTNSYVHTQGLPNTTWTINHQLHTTDVWVQVKDSTGKIVFATVTAIDIDTVRIDFTSAIIGTAVIVAPDSINVPEIKASLITVGQNVTINTNGVLINGSYALTSANIDQQISDAISIESTARQVADTTLQSNIDAEASTRIAADATIALNLSNEVTARIAADSVLQSNIDNKVNLSALGVNVATLVGGTVPVSQLPSYVDDVIEFANQSGFPANGETGKIYVAQDTNKTYRWSGTQYVYITSGAVDSVNGYTGVVSLNKTDVGLSNVDNTADSNKAVLSATKLATARSIAVSGDASGSVSFDGSTNVSITTTLANSGVTAGTYNNSTTAITPFTVDAKGRVTGTGTNVKITPAWDSITSKPTTLSGYGITDAAPLSHANDATLHLTSAQDTWINAITATSTEVNYLSGVTSNVQTQLNGKQDSLGFTAENTANKGVANGYASLGSDGKVPSTQLPSYVDDVIEAANFASLPGTGETGKIYVVQDTNKIYRWSGSTYIEISPTAGNADTATKLATARTISTTGDATWSVSFDGSTNVTSALTLATITDSGSGSFKKVTVNSKGLVTGTQSVAQSDITGLLGAGSITNTMLSNSSITVNGSSISLGGSATVKANTNNSLAVKFDSGTTEGTDLYTFDGSSAKTLDIKAGTNVSITKTSGSITISANDTSVAWSEVTGKPTTISGYGITDAVTSGGNSLPLTNGAVSSNALTTSTTSSGQVVDSNAITSVRTVKYLVQITSGSSFHSSEILVIHDGTNAYLSEYGIVFTSAKLADFDADISGGMLRLLVTPVNAASTIKVIKTYVNV